jgi:hypothetical protein
MQKDYYYKSRNGIRNGVLQLRQYATDNDQLNQLLTQVERLLIEKIREESIDPNSVEAQNRAKYLLTN